VVARKYGEVYYRVAKYGEVYYRVAKTDAGHFPQKSY